MSHECVLPAQVLSALDRIPIIQTTLESLNAGMNELSELKRGVTELKADIWDKEGIDERLAHVGQQSQDNNSDVHALKSDNEKLRKDVNLLKAIVIKLDRKTAEQEKEVVELKGRSMRDNILIHNLLEEENEDLHKRVNSLFKEHLGLDASFVRIHRNSPKPNPNGRPRSITGKLVDFGQKELILKAQKEKVTNQTVLPFRVPPQSPVPVNENRKKLFELNKEYRENGVATRVVGDKLIFPNGNVHRDKVTVPRADDVFTIDDEEQEKLDQIDLQRSSEITDNGNRFVAEGGSAKSFTQVRNIYKKVSSDPIHARANHKVMVYRFKDKLGKLHEGYNDDGEFGTGRKLLKELRDQDISDCAIVIVRWFSGKHLGPKRFSIMENAMLDVAGKIG